VCDRCFVAIEVMCCCFYGRGVITIERSSFAKVILSLVRSRSINLGVRDREGVFTAASRKVSCCVQDVSAIFTQEDGVWGRVARIVL
jgi:hypothetical protein